jgi:hypothetical protein
VLIDRMVTIIIKYVIRSGRRILPGHDLPSSSVPEC